MLGVFIIPTGIGCEIGGHAGDATPAARLIASACDQLIIHPNVVNASDINEMTDNMLYVEGSMLDLFLEGEINLTEVHSNKILVVVNKPVQPETVNAISAARATLGVEIRILQLSTPLKMIGFIDPEGLARGEVVGLEDLIDQVQNFDFDALAIATPIKVEEEVILRYYKHGGANPWGKVEAMVSREVSASLQKPVAHAPIVKTLPPEMPVGDIYNEVVDPRFGAEMVSEAYIHCILKGLSKAPRYHTTESSKIISDQVEFLVSPHGLEGRPHKVCLEQEIPIIYVIENTNLLDQEFPKGIYVKNYIEAAGVVLALKEGISLESLKRPLKPTTIIRNTP